MSMVIAGAMLMAVFFTAMLSGIFGMAGGLILLWLLFLLMPVATAIAVQGIIQIVANGSRAWFSRHYIDWKILAITTSGLVVAALALVLINYKPNLVAASIAIGLLPILIWIPNHWLALDASKPHHAFAAGIISGALNLGAGASGPTVDMFFIRTMMDRRTVIATKAAIQVLSHAFKIAFYWSAASSLGQTEWLAVLIAVPFSIFGTSAGKFLLERMTDVHFRRWTRYVVTAIGLFYLGRAILVLL
ncbi:sulfite exporter TauE/SafE family protein [Devosia rhodophyticola]|uniref:Probable membrane transporter protein n=1 Tax=Devosia rhodophyticola TaxID=3026423 RepID=A0ABY7YZY6_9HYPH|nr:sulfite exporter TauE/SafE family protein [Devosia rhodophyticola]WDR06799.1 sulfite exporter TauE/SafE family protein [Devosia rhodophyticola]